MKNEDTYEYILKALPYAEPFLFVDSIEQISEQGVEGSFRYLATSEYYKGHFKNNPVTPGVILTETMAQIGVVCLGIYLMNEKEDDLAGLQVAMTSSEVAYLLPVYPDETVTVVAEKVYFRFGKLKCTVKMLNQQNETVCTGTIAGMIKGKQPLKASTK